MNESKAVIKGAVFTAVQFILFNFANYSIAMELKVSKEITCK